MSKVKKIVAAVLVLTLAVGASVYGTLAYLKMKTAYPLTNSFIAGGLVPQDAFVLKEHEVEIQPDGTYKLGSEEVRENKYAVLPGVGLPKDPFVDITESLEVEAYLFIEEINSLPKGLTYRIDDAKWAPLMDGENHKVEKDGHPIWVYKGAPFTGKLGQNETNIIKDKTINVPDNFNVAELNENTKLEFNAYLCQAAPFNNNGEGAYGAWNACFAGA